MKWKWQNRGQKEICNITKNEIYIYICVTENLQLTTTMIRLLTVGGTPFDAMQRYAPEECRFACRNINVDPLIVKTICPEGKRKKEKNH